MFMMTCQQRSEIGRVSPKKLLLLEVHSWLPTVGIATTAVEVEADTLCRPEVEADTLCRLGSHRRTPRDEKAFDYC